MLTSLPILHPTNPSWTPQLTDALVHAWTLVVLPWLLKGVPTSICPDGVSRKILAYMIGASVIINSVPFHSQKYSSFWLIIESSYLWFPGSLIPSTYKSESPDDPLSGWDLLNLLQSFLWAERLDSSEREEGEEETSLVFIFILLVQQSSSCLWFTFFHA